MVFIVLMVSTSVCGTDSMGSNPINHPKCPYGGIGIRSGLRSHTIIGSTPITGTIFGKVNVPPHIDIILELALMVGFWFIVILIGS